MKLTGEVQEQSCFTDRERSSIQSGSGLVVSSVRKLFCSLSLQFNQGEEIVKPLVTVQGQYKSG